MAEQYPFVLTNNRIPVLLEALGAAARPAKFSQEFLKTLGFASSNDRAFIPLFRKLGFINGDGAPTEAYDALRVKNSRGTILAEKMRDLYADVFAVNTNMQDASEEELRGALSRITGKDAPTVQRYAATFKALAAQANFKSPPPPSVSEPEKSIEEPSVQPVRSTPPAPSTRHSEFHYNIQIHLPVTTDIAVYHAIFRSLKENLGI